jgi:hypothetical protein
MSWSAHAKGKVADVKKLVDQQFESSAKCAEPEETVRQAARKFIAASLAAQDSECDVYVSAYGSQAGATRRNYASIQVTPEN